LRKSRKIVKRAQPSGLEVIVRVDPVNEGDGRVVREFDPKED
jgi:hypothetical protein